MYGALGALGITYYACFYVKFSRVCQFPKVVLQMYALILAYESLSCSALLSALGFVKPFNFSHAKDYNDVVFYTSNMHFP